MKSNIVLENATHGVTLTSKVQLASDHFSMSDSAKEEARGLIETRPGFVICAVTHHEKPTSPNSSFTSDHLSSFGSTLIHLFQFKFIFSCPLSVCSKLSWVMEWISFTNFPVCLLFRCKLIFLLAYYTVDKPHKNNVANKTSRIARPKPG